MKMPYSSPIETQKIEQRNRLIMQKLNNNSNDPANKMWLQTYAIAVSPEYYDGIFIFLGKPIVYESIEKNIASFFNFREWTKPSIMTSRITWIVIIVLGNAVGWMNEHVRAGGSTHGKSRLSDNSTAERTPGSIQ
jgi:hypothetical protein